VKYVSIDIETTGLKADVNQMVEFGAVVEDMTAPEVPVSELPSFRAIIVDEKNEYRISPFVMRMHVNLFAEMEKVDRDKLDKEGWYENNDGSGTVIVCYPKMLAVRFAAWLQYWNCYSGSKGKVVPAGKNFYGFDYRFIEPVFNGAVTFHHRCLDPVMYYLKATDRKPPDLQLCCERAGIQMTDYHTAVGDARMVVELIRVGMCV